MNFASRLSAFVLGAGLACASSAALAWGGDGHRTVGALADRLLEGSRAGAQVATLLGGGLRLEDAAVWADCAKGVERDGYGYRYGSQGKYRDCARFETTRGEAEMVDFVRRNDDNCRREPGDETCHKQYHYADVALQRRAYALGRVGTSDVDVVSATTAAIRVLQGRPAPWPFSIRDRREALLLLAHYVGDIHQPLHVGALYLDQNGRRVDPDNDGFDRRSETRGGNEIRVLRDNGRDGPNLHALWDDLPAALKPHNIDAGWVAAARRVKPSDGPLDDWAAQWASQSLGQARRGLKDLDFSPKTEGRWQTRLPADYRDSIDDIKQTQLTLAGARLAQVLKAIWP
ncbi:S1/P1 nuclease [Derxia lacustris]|uniref:S1/P1 nuclease n=1 Tax=Derxia lacustris TaxID=764842 RepID=UPI00111BE8B9|nr:S1/P1 nuclease [Derxia lacustris]